MNNLVYFTKKHTYNNLVVLLKDIDTPEVERVNQSLGLLTLDNLVQDLEIFVLELDSLEVGLNARGSNTLGNNRVAALKTPRNKDLSRRHIVLFSNLEDLFILEQGRISTTERRVGSNCLYKYGELCVALCHSITLRILTKNAVILTVLD